MSARRIILVILLAAAVGTAAWLMSRHGRTPGPRLDPSTPEVQHGYRAVAVQVLDGRHPIHYKVPDDRPLTRRIADFFRRVGPPDISLTHFTESPQIAICLDSRVPLTPATRASGRASTGEQVPIALTWVASGGHRLMALGFPLGYPGTFQYVDVELRDSAGLAGTWRVTDLPQPIRCIPPNPVVRDRIVAAGMTVKAEAWVEAGGIGAGGTTLSNVDCVLSAEGKPVAGHQWELAEVGRSGEWAAEPPRFRSLGWGGLALPSKVRWGNSRPVEYASSWRYARIHAELRQFETLDEPVTLRDLKIIHLHRGFTAVRIPAARTISTSSGVTVSLPRQGMDLKRSYARNILSRGVVYVDLALRPGAEPAFLPRSYLCRRFNRPSFALLASQPGVTKWWVDGPSCVHVALKVSHPESGHIDELRLVVRQRVNLRVIPLEFVVPVRSGPP